MKQSWSIVVFCYNEEGTVRRVIDDLLRIFDEHLPSLYEIIVVDDGSTDKSFEKIQAAKEARPDVIKVIRHEKNQGIGMTLRDGYTAASRENLSAVPADGQFNVEELVPHLHVKEGTFISFYRLENLQYTRFRTVLSSMNKYVNRLFNGITLKDVNWVKIYKTKAIKAFPWKLRSSLIESEICAKLIKGGQRPIEVLSYYHPRVSGKSKGASFPIILQALMEVGKLIIIMQGFTGVRQKS